MVLLYYVERWIFRRRLTDVQQFCLLAGSGPLNRDANISGYSPFLAIADFLAKHGCIVLRYDKRGVGASTGNYRIATTFDFAEDARRMLDFLDKQDGVDQQKVGIIGHSEGALIAQMLAATNQEHVKYVILLSSPGLPGNLFAILQAESIARANGMDAGDIERVSNYLSHVSEIIKRNRDNAIASRKIKVAYSAIFGDSKQLLESHSLNEQIISYTSEWTREYMAIKPSNYLPNIKCPVLALTGADDLQVPAKENLDAIRSGLVAGHNLCFSISVLPKMDHFLELSPIVGTNAKISPQLMPEILAWLMKQGFVKAGPLGCGKRDTLCFDSDVTFVEGTLGEVNSDVAH